MSETLPLCRIELKILNAGGQVCDNTLKIAVRVTECPEESLQMLASEVKCLLVGRTGLKDVISSECVRW